MMKKFNRFVSKHNIISDSGIDNTRRRLMICSIFSSFGFLSQWKIAVASIEDKNDDYLNYVVSQISLDHSTTSIVNTYLSQYPEHSNSKHLRRLLTSTTKGRGLEIDIKEKIMNEHKQGNVILVEGWPVTLTEARICALACLTQSIPLSR
jgi:hypothetical protein